MKKSFWIILIIFVLGIFGYYGITGFIIKDNNVSSKFVNCLVDKGAVMYGVSWCSNCQDQKNMLGNKAFEELYKNNGYVECTENQKLCDSRGIKGYPTWIINGTKYEGILYLEELANITGCELSYE